MDSLEILTDRMRKLEEKIRQAKLQLPAHSIKPPVMITLPPWKNMASDIPHGFFLYFFTC